MRFHSLLRFVWVGCWMLMSSGCERKASQSWQGYFEGEFVYVAPALAGRLERLSVQRGQQVEAGGLLFQLDRTSDLAGQREAQSRHQQALARLEDVKKGLRPTELQALEARWSQMRALTEMSARHLDRLDKLGNAGAAVEDDRDRARANHLANQQASRDLESQLATAKLGGREDAIAAAEAEVSATQAAVDRAAWSVNQKTVTTPRAAWVYDTLYREGEHVSASQPVVSLLPPENLKVRFFVPEAEYAALRMGEMVQIHITGRPAALAAKINYLSVKPEYTPPVLYNRENRSKLVFMIEAIVPDPSALSSVHPGQPVEVTR